MTEYDNTNSGALFKNKRKEHDRQPDMRGQVNVEGTEYWVSAWRKVSRKGEPFISMALTPKDDQPKTDDPTDLGGDESSEEPEAPTDYDDEVPF